MEDRPYLSVVVTSRNDDHGGSMLRRMQTFVNALIAQCRRFALPTELIVVEWNPPAGRPPLAEALRWPAETAPCTVRFIEVPAALHGRLQHAEALPLFQMIAKNVGIRRARGEYILATNIDILFNDALMRFLAERRLRTGKMYRIDRHDAETFVPVDAPVDEQLEYCRTHLLRVNAREGTFPLTPAGGQAISSEHDIVRAAEGITLGDGWYALETAGERSYRWVSEQAALIVSASPERRVLALDIGLEGDGTGRTGTLHMHAAGGELIGSVPLTGRDVVYFAIPPCRHEQRLRARFLVPPVDVFSDPRDLRCPVLRCCWSERIPEGAERGEGAGAVSRRSEVCATDVASPETGIAFGGSWFPPETAEGRTFRWMASDALIALRPPNPGRPVLNLLIEPGPGVGWEPTELVIKAADGKPFWLFRLRGGRQVITFPPVDARDHDPTVLAFHFPAGGRLLPGITRVMNARIFGAWWTAKRALPIRALRRGGRLLRGLVGRLKRAVVHQPRPAAATMNTAPAPVTPTTDNSPRLIPFPRLRQVKPVFLHTNACGDFTLMAAQHWRDIRGYPEFEIYSFNIDSLGCYMAHHAGAVEEVLPEPMRVYHIEHGAGSGWTPEGEGKLKERLAAKGIPWLDHLEVLRWAQEMRRLDGPLVFNKDDWGFGNDELRETRARGNTGVRAA